MFERFSPSAIKAIMIAREECTRHGQAIIDSEMLLLGLAKVTVSPRRRLTQSV
jgi:hypothetical protein